MIVSIVAHPTDAYLSLCATTHGCSSARRGSARRLNALSHFAEFEIALDIGQRLHDQRQHRRDQRSLDEVADHRVPSFRYSLSSPFPPPAAGTGSISSGAK